MLRLIKCITETIIGEHVDNFVPIPGTTFETHTTIWHLDDAERVNNWRTVKVRYVTEV